jgi:ABC-type branched-subunit amino acid transport system substrate-binding protein
MYNVQVEDIIGANPQLESVLKIGEEVKIPYKTAYASSAISILENIAKPTKIAFLLPFSNTNPDMNNDRFLEFYSGALLAVNDAKQRGYSFEIYTFDTDRTEGKIHSLLNLPVLKEMDMIVGPAYSVQIQPVINFSKQNQIFTIVPFSSKVQGIAANPYLFQFNPGEDVEINYLCAQFTNGDYKKSNIIIVNSNGPEAGSDWAANLQTELAKKGKKITNIDWNEPSDISAVEAVLKPDIDNILIFNAEKYSSVLPYLSAVKTLSDKNQTVKLFVQYAWLSYSLQKNNIIYLSPFDKDLKTNDLANYQKDFSEFFKWKVENTTPRYDLLGYDLIKYFINQLQNQGTEFTTGKNQLQYAEGIQSQFNFERKNANSGFINNKMYLITTTAK